MFLVRLHGRTVGTTLEVGALLGGGGGGGAH